MGNLDLKFYWAVFLRRLPYFLVIVAFLTAVGGDGGDDPAAGLYQLGQHAGRAAADPGRPRPDHGAGQPLRAGADHRAAADDAGEPLALAKRIGIVRRDRAADDLERAWSATSASASTFIGFTPDVTRAPNTPGATIIGVAFEAPTGEFANKGANELVNLVLEENVRLRTGPGRRHARVLPVRGRPPVGRARAAERQDHQVQDRELRGAARQPRGAAQPPDPRAGAAARARARGGGAEEPARHRRLGVRAHRPLLGDGRPQPGGGAARGAEERADPAAHDLRPGQRPHQACSRAGSPRSRRWSRSSAPRGRCPTPTATRRSRLPGSTSSSRRSTPGCSSSQEDKAAIEQTLAELDRLDPGDAGQRDGAGRARARARQHSRTSTTPPSPTSARPRSASASRCSPRASASR